MSIIARHLNDLFRRTWVRTLTFLGIALGKTLAKAMILLMKSAHRCCFHRARWRKWSRQGRFKALRRTVVSAISLSGIVLFHFFIAELREENISLKAQCELQNAQNRAFLSTLNASGKPAVVQDTKPVARSRQRDADNSQRAARRALRLSDDIMTLLTTLDTNRPTLVLASMSPAITQKSMDLNAEFERHAIFDFFREFAGRIDELLDACHRRHIDASRLEIHFAQLNCTQMFRLVAMDVKGLAQQLQNGKPTQER
jgi:hypothetical protein